MITVRLTPSQPELNTLSATTYMPLKQHLPPLRNAPFAKIPTPRIPSRESSGYVPNSSAQLAMITLEIQSTNERLQQIMHGMDKLTQKMTLINARLDGLR